MASNKHGTCGAKRLYASDQAHSETDLKVCAGFAGRFDPEQALAFGHAFQASGGADGDAKPAGCLGKFLVHSLFAEADDLFAGEPAPTTNLSA